MSKHTSGSSNGHGSTAQRLAVAQHERRQAIYEAGAASEPPPLHHTATLDGLGPPRDTLPTIDELIGPEAPKARWKLVLALAAALGGLGELARQIATLFGKH